MGKRQGCARYLATGSSWRRGYGYRRQSIYRKGVDKDERTRSIENEKRARLLKDQQDEILILKESAKSKIKEIVVGKVSLAKIIGSNRKVAIEKKQVITESGFDRIPFEKLRDIHLKDAEQEEVRISEILDNYEKQINLINTIFETKIGAD